MKNQFNKVDPPDEPGKSRTTIKKTRTGLLTGSMFTGLIDVLVGTAIILVRPDRFGLFGGTLIVWGVLLIGLAWFNGSAGLRKFRGGAVGQSGSRARLTFSSFYWFNDPAEAQAQGVELVEPIGKIGGDTIYQTARANGFTYKFLRIQKDREIEEDIKGIGVGEAIYGLEESPSVASEA